MPNNTKTKSKRAPRKANKKQVVKVVPKQDQKQQAYHSKVLTSWVSPEYADHHKGIIWYVLAGLVLVGILWYSLMSASWSTAVVFVLFAGVYLMNMHSKPRDAANAITELGVQVGGQFYAFSQIKGFWIVYKPPRVSTLHIQLVGKRDDIAVELDEQSPAVVRNLLSREIPEIEGKGESFVNYVTRVLKL
jgi:hypothetical protein